MNEFAIESLAAEVAKTYKLTLPMDLERVCREEGIELAPGNYSPRFHGRLEFHPAEGAFILFHPLPNRELTLGRIRFSICHELGHFYIEEHRDLIVSGRVHNSVEPFRSVLDRIEREADIFAAALLIPESALWKFVGRRDFLSLDAIFQLAELANASVQATAFRYVTTTDDVCVAVFSKGKQIIKARSSRGADDKGFGILANRIVPDNSTALSCLSLESREIIEGASHTAEWFSSRSYGAKLWTESARLGADYAVTILSWPEAKEE